MEQCERALMAVLFRSFFSRETNVPLRYSNVAHSFRGCSEEIGHPQLRIGPNAVGKPFGHAGRHFQPEYNDYHQIAEYRRVVDPQEASIVKRIF
jgi:hypothetical protein